MKEFAENEYAAMTTALTNVNSKKVNKLLKAEESYNTVLESIGRLKDHLLSYTFENASEEIHFFKEVKPRFLKELIYYSELYHLEACLPVGDAEIQTRYYKHELERLRIFFERNQQLYNYYRSGKSYYDELFFLREADAPPIGPEYMVDMDPRFGTVHSYKLSKLQAFEQFSTYLKQSMYLLDHPEAVKVAEDEPQHAAWTDTKVDLIEMGYGIFVRGSVDNGKASLKQIMRMLGKIFNVDLSNYPTVIQQNIRLRKRKSRMNYLNSVIEMTERRMDDLDANPIRG